jgi:predicted transcriptional regulator of viral defense system
MRSSSGSPRHTPSGKDRVIDLARRQGVLRPRDLAPLGLDRKLLTRLCEEGLLERRVRGIYTLPNADLGARQTLVEVAARVPHGVICLLSALRFHDLTTQNPADVWLAIDRNARAPREPGLPLRIVRFSGKASTSGVEVHQISGVPVRIYDPAKTVVDCFKYRHKIGIDVAVEALRDYLRRRGSTVDPLWRYAAVDRVSNVMGPYLQAAV